METDRSWIRCLRPRPHPEMKLLCFPHAGGGTAMFRSWPDAIGPRVEIWAAQYPGREMRLGENTVNSMDQLVEPVTAALAAASPDRFALFGHSMGGAVAYEVALRLRSTGCPGPAHVFISGRQAPDCPRSGSLHQEDDEVLVQELIRLRPATGELLRDPEFADLVLPMIRADHQLIENYQPTSAPPLGCPLTAMAARGDTELTLDEAAAWHAYTTGSFRLEVFPGGHFFPLDHRDKVIETIAGIICEHGTAPGGEAYPGQGLDDRKARR